MEILDTTGMVISPPIAVSALALQMVVSGSKPTPFHNPAILVRTLIESSSLVDFNLMNSASITANLKTIHILTQNLPPPIPPGVSSLLIGFFEFNSLLLRITEYPTAITTDGGDVVFTNDTLSNSDVKSIAYLA